MVFIKIMNIFDQVKIGGTSYRQKKWLNCICP
jgi:hypothetical protein